MNPEEVQQLKLLIVATAAYYGHKLEREVLPLYIEDLEDLPFHSVAEAIKAVRKDPRASRFPLPAALRALISPQEDPQQLAIIVANRIWAAIGQFGWSNANQAKEALEGLAWEAIQEAGGWGQVCQDSGETEAGIFKAQMRELARAVHDRARDGKLRERIALPSSRAGLIPISLPQMP